MADTKEKESEEAEESAPKEKKSPLVLIIVIVVLILVILIGAVVAVLFMGGEDEVQPMQQTQQVQNSSSGNNYQTSSSKSQALPKGATFDQIGIMFPLDTFTVNLLSESGRRYLKVEMNLELEGEELGVELDSKKAVIRDIIIRLLSSKSLEEISTMKGKDKLKQQIVNQLNSRVVDGHINNVYFTEFVIQ